MQEGVRKSWKAAQSPGMSWKSLKMVENHGKLHHGKGFTAQGCFAGFATPLAKPLSAGICLSLSLSLSLSISLSLVSCQGKNRRRKRLFAMKNAKTPAVYPCSYVVFIWVLLSCNNAGLAQWRTPKLGKIEKGGKLPPIEKMAEK